MQKYKYMVVLFISLTSLSLELIWTRIFSAEFFYTFAFLILSLSIAGLGIGALIVSLSKKITNINLSIILSLAAICSLAGPPLVFLIDLDFTEIFSNPTAIFKILLSIIILSSSYLFAGISLARIFRDFKEQLPKLYMSDMIGAGLGCTLALIIMNLLSTPVAAAYAGLPVAVAAIIIGKRKNKILPVFIIIAMIVFSFFSKDILEKEDDQKAQIIYEHWDAMAKIKIYEYNKNYRGLITDNTSGSTVIGFDGNFNIPDSEKFDYGINIKYLLRRTKPCTFLSIGAGGGMDVMQALQENAAEVHAVEVNPHINYLMTDGSLASFTGGIYHHPNVRVITEDARAYIRKFENKFDIIFARNANSYAALASGAFALAENYLYTTEAFMEYWHALSSEGYIIMDHQSYGPRIVATVIDALNNIGIENPKQHIAVYESKEFHRYIILVSKKALSNTVIRYAFDELKYNQPKLLRLIYPTQPDTKNDLITHIIENGWQNSKSDAMIDISPTTDNKPFIAQLGLWRNLKIASFEKVMPSDEFYGFPVSQLIIVIIIAVSIFILLPVNILPYFKYKKPQALKISEWLYFFLIGLAYMSVEIILIQKYTLFIGPSVYGLITILSVLLFASGLGSRFSGKFSISSVFIIIIILLMIDIFLYTKLIYLLGSLNLILRIIITALMIFPLGFFMGMPFPKAGIKIGKMIDWAFAVNGTAAVLGSGLILLIAFNYGFDIALAFSAIVYLSSFFFFKKFRI
jgi:predicted membrane-bound spermidine synthase